MKKCLSRPVLMWWVPLMALTWVLTALQYLPRPHEKLSDYGFFSGELKEQQPATGVVPYNVNTPLFSDYAEKLRFIKMPEGAAATYNDSTVFEFPVGTILIKTFYFPIDFRDPSKGRRLMETRLLVHEAGRWRAYPYVWNEAQTDAFLDVAGQTLSVSYSDGKGRKQQAEYVVPDVNQCKGCHNKSDAMVPIGLSAWQLNRMGEAGIHQLLYWKGKDMIRGLPDTAMIPKGYVWDDPSTGSLDQRVREWLDINCAHCHRPLGPANTSGLFLNRQEKDPLRLGIMKTPVAAGRGSGNRNYDIVPGKPDASILIYRMESTDPGVMMPELGRKQIPRESVQMVKQWIRDMKGANAENRP